MWRSSLTAWPLRAARSGAAWRNRVPPRRATTWSKSVRGSRMRCGAPASRSSLGRMHARRTPIGSHAPIWPCSRARPRPIPTTPTTLLPLRAWDMPSLLLTALISPPAQSKGRISPCSPAGFPTGGSTPRKRLRAPTRRSGAFSPMAGWRLPPAAAPTISRAGGRLGSGSRMRGRYSRRNTCAPASACYMRACTGAAPARPAADARNPLFSRPCL
jgi:hypothetical protein